MTNRNYFLCVLASVLSCNGEARSVASRRPTLLRIALRPSRVFSDHGTWTPESGSYFSEFNEVLQ